MNITKYGALFFEISSYKLFTIPNITNGIKANRASGMYYIMKVNGEDTPTSALLFSKMFITKKFQAVIVSFPK